MIIAQVKPSAATGTVLYTATAGTVISSVIACNQGTSPDKIRISISVAGAGTSSKDYLIYDLSLSGNDSYIFTGGITLNNTDVVRVFSLNGSSSFNLFGI